MNDQLKIPGTKWFLWMRNAALRVGILTGIYLSATFVAWLLVANRAPWLDAFAGVRNTVGAATMILLMLIPLIRFYNEPAKLIASSLTAWSMLTITYAAAEFHFSLLENRISALQLFMLGAVSYGLVAVTHWVFMICAEARHQHVKQSQHAAPTRRSRAF